MGWGEMKGHSKVDANGRISVFEIKVPLVLALGQYERLTDTEIHEHLTDIVVEIKRRKGE